MRGDQLSKQWRILRAIESKKQGTTVDELASQEECFQCTIWQDLAAIQNVQLPLLFHFNLVRDSLNQRKAKLATRNSFYDHGSRWAMGGHELGHGIWQTG